MNPILSASVIAIYFGILFIVSRITSRKSNAESFYDANNGASWILVGYGMIGVVISGLTFISVPGQVTIHGFSYMQMVFGFSVGMLMICFILLPIFYKQKEISIYAYLGRRFGENAKLVGSWFFIVAQLLSSSIKLYLMAFILQLLIFDALGLPFWLTLLITLGLIWTYTYKGGIKTVILTDVLQTTFLVVSLVATIYFVLNDMDISFSEMNNQLAISGSSDMFRMEWSDPRNFFKMFFAGAVITFMNNGLDQSVMQKNLACDSLKSAQKNMIMLAVVLLAVNLLVLYVGGALSMYADHFSIAIPEKTDEIFTLIATQHLGSIPSILFLLGIAAAAYSSADSSLTGLTTSFCVDVLHIDKSDPKQVGTRIKVHLGFTVAIFIIILLINQVSAESMLDVFLKMSGFVYGPILALYLFGLCTKRRISEKFIIPICLTAPIVSWLVDFYSSKLLGGYSFGFEIAIVNVLLALALMFVASLTEKRS